MKNFDLTSEELEELRATHKAAKKKLQLIEDQNPTWLDLYESVSG